MSAPDLELIPLKKLCRAPHLGVHCRSTLSTFPVSVSQSEEICRMATCEPLYSSQFSWRDIFLTAVPSPGR